MNDYFLNIDGIPGESQDSRHKDWIELASFSWGLTHPGAGTGSGHSEGRAQFEGFRFVMAVNKASPRLFLACASGTQIKEASLSVVRPGSAPLEYLKMKLSEVLVTSFAEAAGEEEPQDTVGFNFDRIEMDYTPQQATGTTGTLVKSGWDLSRNAKF